LKIWVIPSSRLIPAKKPLEILRREDSIDLVVTDQAMPKMTGTELAKVIRSEGPDIPVLLATGYADMGPRDEIGLTKLTKPYCRATSLLQSYG
jgi:CheY-like chemotaxis protein